jgi:hypothetical protein
MKNFVLEAALQYQSLGWSVIPIKRGTKRPDLKSWRQYQESRPSEKELRCWFPDSGKGLAVITGAVSGNLVCRDFDDKTTYDDWASKYPKFAKSLPTVITSRGRHVYCRSSFNRLIHVEQGELRGGNGYCILPPSTHPDGIKYRWAIKPKALIPALDLNEVGFLTANVTERTEETGEDGGELRRVLGCVAGNLEQKIERIIQTTAPVRYGTRHRAVFQFARALRSLPSMWDAGFNDLIPHVRRFHLRALPFIRTKPFEEIWFDFREAWEKIKFPIGADPMSEIFARANRQLNGEWPYEQSSLSLLVFLCKELQRTAEDSPFFLSCRTAGRLLEMEHTQAARWLRNIERDGWIKTIEKGTATSMRATRFRYVGPM